MSEMLPETEIVGVELSPANVALARRVLAERKSPNVTFAISPDGNSLPDSIGSFDFVMLSAVFEHLLPDERHKVIALIWSSMKMGGALFINQTPHSYFPYEHHSTALWFVNYLPDGVSHYLARHMSKVNPEINRSNDWNDHLRGGIRGGSEREVLSLLRENPDGRPVILQPKSEDRAAYWLSGTNPERYFAVKKLLSQMFRITDRLWGVVPSINMDVVIQKMPR